MDAGLAGVKPASDPTDLLDRAVALDSQLSHLTNLTLEILTRQSSAATKLDSAAEMTQELHLILANPKQRGDWGEILAEDVLRPRRAPKPHQLHATADAALRQRPARLHLHDARRA